MSVCKLSQCALGPALLAWAVVSTFPGQAVAQPAPPRPAAAPAPPRPAAPPPAVPPPAVAPPAARPAVVAAAAIAQPVDGARAGVAIVLRGAQGVALGLVLASDGRVVTSLASLGGNKKNLSLRFADGSTVTATVGHEDARSDLALIVPARAGWTRGLAPSAVEPTTSSRLTYYELKANKPEPREAPASRAAPLAIPVVGALFLGSPVVDESGAAVGIVVHSCDVPEGKKTCLAAARVVPVTTLRGFLRALPATAVVAAPYLGVRSERAVGSFARGVRITEIGAGSPAAQAKLAAGPDGDLILGVAGQPVTTHDELSRAIGRHAPGEKVALTLFSRGAYRQVDVVLTRAPSLTGSAGPASTPGGPPGQPPPAPAPRGPAPGSATDGAPKDFGQRR